MFALGIVKHQKCTAIFGFTIRLHACTASLEITFSLIFIDLILLFFKPNEDEEEDDVRNRGKDS